MSAGISPGRKSIDKRIEEFCESSSELLTGIHTRHDNGNGEKPKRKRRRKKKN